MIQMESAPISSILFAMSYPVIQGISITQGIGQCYLCMSLLLVCSLYCSLQVTQIVQAVEDTDDINTVCDGFLYEILYYVICIVDDNPECSVHGTASAVLCS